MVERRQAMGAVAGEVDDGNRRFLSDPLTGYTEPCTVDDEMTIRVLEQVVASQIAAGEVVERPASVVKELVENSLDAGATQVTVEAGGSGVSLIRVTDNGGGIPRDELAVAFERYATSKVSSITDLTSITSFGFRGEALPSIAAVAEVDIVSCVAGETIGSLLRLKAGRVSEQGQQGRSPGTTVTVRNLFRDVPARLKFLKSAGTENGHIARVVSEYALAFPEVRFGLTVDGRPVLRTPGSGRLVDSAVEVYGADVAGGLLEIGDSNDAWQGGSVLSPAVTGMVGSPSLNRANRDYLSFFINRRAIDSRMLSWAVEEAYHGLLMQGRHPVAIINVALPPGEVDVNIHPTKAEVKFRNERAVFGAVQRAVRATLVELAPVPRIEEPTATYTAPPSAERPPSSATSSTSPASTAGYTPSMPVPARPAAASSTRWITP